jgi:hypothetical protein
MTQLYQNLGWIAMPSEVNGFYEVYSALGAAIKDDDLVIYTLVQIGALKALFRRNNPACISILDSMAEEARGYYMSNKNVQS